MEFSQIALYQGQAFLAWATGIMVLVVGGFLIKLLINLATLAKNLNDTSVLINTELKPTLNELNQTLASINSIIKSTDEGVDNFKTAVERIFGKTKALTGNIFGGIIKGFATAFNMFSKK